MPDWLERFVMTNLHPCSSQLWPPHHPAQLLRYQNFPESRPTRSSTVLLAILHESSPLRLHHVRRPAASSPRPPGPRKSVHSALHLSCASRTAPGSSSNVSRRRSKDGTPGLPSKLTTTPFLPLKSIPQCCQWPQEPPDSFIFRVQDFIARQLASCRRPRPGGSACPPCACPPPS